MERRSDLDAARGLDEDFGFRHAGRCGQPPNWTAFLQRDTEADEDRVLVVRAACDREIDEGIKQMEKRKRKNLNAGMIADNQVVLEKNPDSCAANSFTH